FRHLRPAHSSTLSLHDALPICFLLALPRVTARQVICAGRAVGYFYVNGETVGPCAWLAPEHAEGVLAHARAFCGRDHTARARHQIGRAHVLTPVTLESRMPSSA